MKSKLKLIVYLIGIIILFKILTAITSCSTRIDNEKIAEQAIRYNNTLRDDFSKNRNDIISSIKENIHISNYNKANEIIKKYRAVNDPEIESLQKDVQEVLLIQELKIINSNFPDKKIEIVNKLIGLKPENNKYKQVLVVYQKEAMQKEIKDLHELLNYTSDKTSEQQEKQLKIYSQLIKLEPEKQEYKKKVEELKLSILALKYVETVNSKIQSQFKRGKNPENWVLANYIKSHIADSDSYGHVSTRYALTKENVIAVDTIYRAKNAFGAIVFNRAIALITLNGNVMNFQPIKLDYEPNAHNF